MRSPITLFPELVRATVSLSVTFSAFAAWTLASGKISVSAMAPLTAIFLLACGASVINQVQEKAEDARMDRTKNRPIPSARLSPENALLIAALLVMTGLALLAAMHLWICLLLGLVNILWYNGFYTWLKKKTAFAVVPGALSGVIPVFMGWSAAGATLFQRPVLLLAFFIFMWQIPHFWLLMLRYREEYRLAGFPVMTDHFGEHQFRNIILAWVAGATGTSIVLIFSGFWLYFFSKVLILILNLVLLALFFHPLLFQKNPHYRLLIMAMNIFLLAVLGMIILEKLFP